jgi:DNA-binding LytR/AlgR family response regulator
VPRTAGVERGKEILLAVGDIAGIEAADNYAVLHVGGQTYEMRSSLTRLESEVEPWMSGDWRIRMDDGAEVSLSRRYRDRFEAAVPVKA